MEDREQEILAKLDSELSVDAASVEYYVSMPFDERLHYLLDNETTTIEISTSRESSQQLDKRFFPPNSIQPTDLLIDDDTFETIDIDSFTFRMSGSLSLSADAVSIDASISSHTDEANPVRIRNSSESKDEFFIYKDSDDGLISSRLNTKDLLVLLGSLSNIETSSLSRVLSTLETDNVVHPASYNHLIENLWSQLGDEFGSKIEKKTISVEIPQTNEHYSEVIKLRYEEEEIDSASIVRLTLENVKRIERADVEDVHTLRLAFSSKESDTINQSAERLVSSGITPMHLMSIDGLKTEKGRPTVLNLNDPEVIEQFVNWFDQLVSA